MNEEEICQICEERKVTDECVSCHKKICSDCCISGVGVCVECSRPKEKDLIPMLTSCGAIQYGTFTLASGKESSYYVDMKKAITEIPILKKVSEIMAPYIGPSDKIGCVEMGAVPIAVALALQTERPYIIIRKEPKEHGTQKAFEGEILTGESVIFVEDVTTTGGSLVRAINLIRDSGGVIEKALVIVDREEGAAENLGNIGVELIPLVRASEIKQ
ncbi:MAG: orotate phosphoribosyltransferase [Thermoplasmata archaeon]